MSAERPAISENPLVQSNDIDIYISCRLRERSIDLYSAFMLAHESLRISRFGYLQSAWGRRLTIFRLLRLYMHCLTARAFRSEAIAVISEGWFMNDIPLLEEKRPHFFVKQLESGIDQLMDKTFLETLSNIRDKYDSLSDDDGPYHFETFPYQEASPERELLVPGSQSQFQTTNEELDPEVEDLIVELCTGAWA